MFDTLIMMHWLLRVVHIGVTVFLAILLDIRTIAWVDI